MSWLRSAVYKAVEVSGTSNLSLSRAVRTYADTVVNQAGQAVVGGSRLLPDRIGARNFQSYKHAVKRLEEVSVTCRGIERVQVLRRWLVALKEIKRQNEALNLVKSGSLKDPPARPTTVMYYDHDHGGEPMNFQDVFLRSQALEGITLSLILEEPNDEELSLLLEIYRLCLNGGDEAHDVTLSCVKDLARAFSTYSEEVLVKREELLQYVQDAIAGLKVNSEIVRIDSEVSNIHKKLCDFKNQLCINERKKSPESASDMQTKYLEEDLENILLYSRLGELLLQKKFMKTGDSPTAHKQKVDKLIILSESLAGSASKAEKRIFDNRIQKEEALKFRVAKTGEVNQLEKELAAEIKALECRKDELEEELRKVNNSLTSARARLRNAREERDQFDEASNQIIQHFKVKEDELSKSIASYRAEAKVCNTFISFLKSTWAFQSYCAQQKDKIVSDELEKHKEYLMDVAMNLLTAYKEDLEPCISSVQELVQNLKRLDKSSDAEETEAAANPRRNLEKQYQIRSAKIITAFSIVESIKKQLYMLEDTNSRENGNKIHELLDTLEEMKVEFESIEKPSFKIEDPNIEDHTPPKERAPKIRFLSQKQRSPKKLEANAESTSGYETQRGINPLAFAPFSLPLSRMQTSALPRNNDHLEHLEPIGVEIGKMKSNAEALLSKLKLELELENHIRGNSMEGIIDWEFDEMIPRNSL
ncbi:uncharacterized protein LOC127250824 [Andrographis paniculata]|uniref:uncharacterized protein LOC127250824 n=1 Tax=Andrographis paniculata TaxID=175694 RepID=UPI0021E870C4|nr:uncharacterized protein LOC127250824 [Andrographis paniculata]